jgi:hypothetical protein
MSIRASRPAMRILNTKWFRHASSPTRVLSGYLTLLPCPCIWVTHVTSKVYQAWGYYQACWHQRWFPEQHSSIVCDVCYIDSLNCTVQTCKMRTLHRSSLDKQHHNSEHLSILLFSRERTCSSSEIRDERPTSCSGACRSSEAAMPDRPAPILRYALSRRLCTATSGMASTSRPQISMLLCPLQLYCCVVMH